MVANPIAHRERLHLECSDGARALLQSNHAHRLRELDLSLLELLHDEQVDRLLAVHVRVVIRAENVVYRLEFQRPVGETEETRSVEARAILRLDRLTHQPGNLGHLLARRTVRYAAGRSARKRAARRTDSESGSSSAPPSPPCRACHPR